MTFRYRTRFYKSGYREALENDEVNEEILQGSFDEGYTIGLRLGRKFSMIRFSTKLAEGMYEEQRLLANSQEALQKLKDFNLKLDGLWAQLDTLIRKGCETKEDLTKVIMTFYFCSALQRGFCFIPLKIELLHEIMGKCRLNKNFSFGTGSISNLTPS